MKARRFALAALLCAMVALAFAAWLRPASVLALVSVVPFCQ